MEGTGEKIVGRPKLHRGLFACWTLAFISFVTGCFSELDVAPILMSSPWFAASFVISTLIDHNKHMTELIRRVSK